MNFSPEGFKDNKDLSLSMINNAMLNNLTLEARVKLCDTHHNLILDLDGIDAIIPKNECVLGIETGKTRDIAIISRVGKDVCFKVIDISEKNGKPLIILSRKKAQEEALNYILNNLKPGDIIDAKITHQENFGVFVDIGCGVTSLIGIENISISRISHPRERFNDGNLIKAVISSIDKTLSRINLSHRELLGTWAENTQNFEPCTTVSGIVRSVEEYGIFVELSPNLSGLAEFKEDVKVGDLVSVYIKSIIPEKMKIKLLLIDTLDKDNIKPSINYFLTSGNIKEWVYTPKECTSKFIATHF